MAKLPFISGFISIWLNPSFFLKMINCRKAFFFSVIQPELYLPQKQLPGSWEMAFPLRKNWFDYRKSQESELPMASESWGMYFSHKSPSCLSAHIRHSVPTTAGPVLRITWHHVWNMHFLSPYWNALLVPASRSWELERGHLLSMGLHYEERAKC